MIRTRRKSILFFFCWMNKRKEKTREMPKGRDNKGAHRMKVMRGTQHRPGLYYDTTQKGKQKFRSLIVIIFKKRNVTRI